MLGGIFRFIQILIDHSASISRDPDLTLRSAERSVWSGSALFAYDPQKGR